MSELSKRIPVKTFKPIVEDSVPGIEALFKDAAELCKKNPSFQSGLVVALVKGAVAREKYGSNAQLQEKVVNFYCFLRTYDKRAAQMVSANMQGPSDCWLRTLEAEEQQDIIIDSGKNGEKVQERMVAVLERRSGKSGKPITFSVAIDATKLAQVILISIRFCLYVHHFIFSSSNVLYYIPFNHLHHPGHRSVRRAQVYYRWGSSPPYDSYCRQDTRRSDEVIGRNS